MGTRLDRAGANCPHFYIKVKLRHNLGRSSNGGVVFGREGDPDLALPRGSWKKESSTLTESWGVRECGRALCRGVGGCELCRLWWKNPHFITSEREREEASLS